MYGLLAQVDSSQNELNPGAGPKVTIVVIVVVAIILIALFGAGKGGGGPKGGLDK